MMATNWRQISFQTVAKIAPETKQDALATLQLQFPYTPRLAVCLSREDHSHP
jgi:hypothetical protein